MDCSAGLWAIASGNSEVNIKRIIPIVLFAAAVVAVHLGCAAAGKGFYLTQLTMSVYYSIVVIGLCLVMGYAGQVSLGHGAFFAIGGYTSAVLTTYDFMRFKDATWAQALHHVKVFVMKQDVYGSNVMNVTPGAAFIAAMALTFAVACLIGYPALRLKGHYLSMATLGFGVIVNKMVLGTSLTGSADGISGVPAWKLVPGLIVSGKSANRIENYYIACGLALVLLILLSNLVRSRIGRALQAIHDRETAANAIGINTAAYKLKAFVVSAMLAAIAGVFFTHYSGGIGPSEAGALKSVRYVALAAAGGMANLWGAMFVSTSINFCSLRGWFGSYDNGVFGAILIIMISAAPQGPFKPLNLALRRLLARCAGKRGGGHVPA